ncbi:MAG: hypothetical protein CR979_02070 [Propionibacterium sp.]|nr:MAG: hypothetical protein CR979_02070 [Propionibacterium sp.]
MRAIARSGLAFLISGGTGTGKTTLLSAMLGELPPTDRIVIVEDSRELNPDHPHCVRLAGRAANAEGIGEVTMTQLVRQALRMRPDRLVVGEVRGAEISDLLTALNTGHEGGCGTIHANSIADLPARLESLAALSGMNREACHSQIAAALTAAIQLRRLPNGQRTVEQIGLFRRHKTGEILVSKAVSCSADGLIWTAEGEELKELL